ncbi:MAG: Tat pathway signal sequence domain protein [Inquilinus sp.]|nr:Tat pathway signal sequence domain protein [Inquilinus sp.]
MRLGIVLGLAAALTVAASGAAAQGEAGRLTIELNKLEPQGEACRSYLVIDNATEVAVAELVLDLYVFNRDGVIERRIALDTREVPPGKTQVRLFDIRDIGCGEIERLLVNGVLSCRDADGERSDCEDLLALRSRAGVDLDG